VVLMQAFLAVVGANGSLGNVLRTTPSLFAFASVQIAVHLLVTLAAGRLLGLDRKLLLTRRDSRARVRGRLQLAPVMGPLPVTARGPCWPRPNVRHCNKNYCSTTNTVAEAQYLLV